MPARNFSPAARPPGRPLKIDDPCRDTPVLDQQGQPTGETRTLTVGESILGDLAAGMPKRAAVQRAGITMETFYDWERRGRSIRTHPPQDPRTRKPRRLVENERRLARFSVEVDQAEAEGHGRYFGAQATAALRPSTTTKRVTVTETTPDGTVVSVRTTEEQVQKPPSEEAQRFILRHRYREDWADSLEVTAAGGAPILNTDAVAAGILEKLRAIQTGAPLPELPPGEEPIEADSQEVPDPD